MSYSIPAISSTGNGTADYIDDGVSGSLFMDNDVNDLTRAILAIVSDRELLIRMGTSAYINIQNNYLFDNYYRALKDQGLLNE
jgi:glycosyltransferase involved in cell wall biosynthesis